MIKAYLFVLVSLLASMTCFGQVYVNGVAIDTVNTPFCQLVCTNASVWTKASVMIDYGQRYVDTGLNRQKIAGADKQPITFNSPVDALNFMSRQGWELVSFNVIDSGSGTNTAYVYLLQRRKI